MNISKNIPGFTSLKNGCTRSPGAPKSSPDVGCPALVQQGECWPNTAPCGVREPDLLAKTDLLGVPFSQNAWAAAQQEGCLGCPDRYPKWPPPTLLPKLDIPHQTMALDIVDENPNFHLFETPFLQNSVEMGLTRQDPASSSSINSWVPSWPETPPTQQPPPQQPPPKQPPPQQPPPQQPPAQYPQAQQPPRMTALQPHMYKNNSVVPDSMDFEEDAYESGDDGIDGGNDDDDTGESDAYDSVKKNNMKTKIKLMVNSLKAIVYDLKHWENLKNMSFVDKLSHIFMRDERAMHLTIFVFICLVITLLINTLLKQS